MQKGSPLLQNSGWTVVETLPQDGALRSYTRIERNGKRALYMDCGPQDVASATRLAADFIPVCEWLRSLGLRAPEIYEVDLENNAAIIEDFGPSSVKQAIANGVDAQQLYSDAAKILKTIQAADCPLDLQNYQNSFMRKARQRFVDWYVPVLRGKPNPPGFTEEYHALWDEIERGIGPYNECFMHVDFHVENLMYLGGEGVGSIGIIDFQEGMFGPEVYDLVNLLEDMRADVPLDIQKALLEGKPQSYLNWYRVLGTQFHCRLLGQIIRWAIVEDKQQYMQYYARLIPYVERALEDPVLAPFKAWLERENIILQDASTLDWDAARHFIGKDAV